jgi:hypothetical protein
MENGFKILLIERRNNTEFGKRNTPRVPENF